MKTLQNNFTTPEQSKRLLELGVPADSADCYYEKNASLSGEWEYEPCIGECVAIKQNLFSYRNGYIIPCWSVGRLVEIICKVRTHYIGDSHLVFNFKDGALDNMTEAFVKTLECDYNDGCIDFSKLEE